VSGTRPSLRTDRRGVSSLIVAAGAALLLAVFTLLSGLFPVFTLRLDIVVSMMLGASLLALIVYGLLPLRATGDRLLAFAAVGVLVAAAGHLADLAAIFDLGKILLGATLGFWLGVKLAELTGDVRWVAGVAVVVAVVDVVSVFASFGVTNLILTRSPETVPYFVVAFPTFGYSVHNGDYSALGTADVIFFGLYLVSAAIFGLRVRLTAAAMAVSIVATVAIAMVWRALPALPLMGLAFLAVNADRLWAQMRSPAQGQRRA